MALHYFPTPSDPHSKCKCGEVMVKDLRFYPIYIEEQKCEYDLDDRVTLGKRWKDD